MSARFRTAMLAAATSTCAAAALGAPAAQISFGGGAPVAQDFSAPYFLDVTDTFAPNLDCCGQGHGQVDLAAGTLKAEVTSTSPLTQPTASQYAMITLAQDDFTLVAGPGLVAGMHLVLGATLSATGIAVAPLPDAATPPPGGQSFGRAYVGLTTSGSIGGTPFVEDAFSTEAPAPHVVAPGVPFVITLSATNFFDVVVGQPFSFGYFLQLEAANATSIDMFHTARLSFALPAGARIVSAGGYAQAAGVPEPSAAAMLSVGLLVLAARSVRRRRS